MKRITLEKPSGILSWLKLACLYRSAFPPQERKPFWAIAKAFREGRGHVWCICRGRQVLGLATTVNGKDLILLDYLAVDKKHRDQGIGSEAMEALKEIYHPMGIFVEIEDPWVHGPGREARQKRKEFYVNQGFVPLQVMAEVFGVDMELLGWQCRLDFEGYKAFYHDYNSPWAAEHVHFMPYPWK